MKVRVFKYFSPFLLYAAAIIAFTEKGWLVWVPVLYGFVLIPLIELAVKPDPANLSDTEEQLAKANKWYDYLLYMVVPIQYAALAFFLYSVKTGHLSTMELTGRIVSMGLLCGVFGINVAHELGHRVQKGEQFMAKALLLTSLYMHFFIEHNRGHHKNVATHEDPSSARFGEVIYSFYVRTIVFSYISAWSISKKESKRKGYPFFSLHNEMVRFQIIEIAFLALIKVFFGWATLLYFILAAVIGILLLETVNYIEHYGLQRQQLSGGKYERALPVHSWNSNHIIGRVMLFELSRHSDHHYLASRKYQLLRHHDRSPQMPTGYPGMMLLSLLPPLWFRVMDPRVKVLKEQQTQVFTHPA